MKYFKWVIIGFGSVIVVVLLTLFGIQFYLNTEQVRLRIHEEVNQAISGTLTWSQNRFSVLEGKVELNHVLLTGPENDKLIELERFAISISWTGLLKGELTVNDLFWENPNVFLVKDRSGRLNLIQALHPPGGKTSKPYKNGSLPFNIVFQQLRVVNGFFHYIEVEKTAKTKTDEVMLQNVNLTITDANLLKQSGRIFCQVAKGKIQSKSVLTTIDRLSLKADVQKNQISELLFDVNTDGINASITGTIENLFTDKPIIDLSIESRAYLSKIKDSMMLEAAFSGAVQVNSTIQGVLDNPNIDVDLSYHGGKLAGKRIDRIHLICRLKEKILNIDDLYVYTPLGQFIIKGDVNFRKAFGEGLLTSHPDLNEISYKLSINQKGFQLADLQSVISGFKGVASANIELEGKGVYPDTLWAKTALELYIDNLSAGEGRLPLNLYMNARADIKKERVTLQSLIADAGGIQLEMNGNYIVPSQQVSAHFKLEAPDLTKVMTSFGVNGVQGRLNVSGEVAGTALAPVMDVLLDGKNLGFKNIRLGKADANIRFVNGRFFLENGKILNDNSELNISGFAQIFNPESHALIENPDFEVSMTGNALFLEDFVQGMKGKFALNGRANGSLGHPKGQLNLSGKNVDINMQKFNEIKLSSTIEGHKIHMDPLSLVIVPGEKIVLNGWVSTDKEYSFSMISNDISLKNIEQAAALKIDTGKTTFDISGKGSLGNPRLNGMVVLSDLSFNNQRLGKVPFELKVEDQTVYIFERQNFNLNAAYGLRSRSFSASARFENTDLTPYLQLIGIKELNGAITGSVESKGNFGTPTQIEGTASISHLGIFWQDTPLIKGDNVMLLLNNGEISIPEIQLSLVDQGHITIKGSGEINKAFNVEADGNIPFKILPMFTEAFSAATGETRFSLKMSGSLPTPNLIIHADIKDGGITIPNLSQILHNVNGGIRITSDAIVLDDIKGMLDTGKFELNGTIDLDRYQPSTIVLKLTSDNLPISIPELLDARVSSKLYLRGSTEKSLLKGNIELIEGTYTKDAHLNFIERISQQPQEVSLEASKTTPWPIFDNMALDCSISYRDPFVVDNNIALLTIKPELQIQGTINQPLISGRVEIQSGTVYFQKNEFDVKKGVFDFINPYKIEPTIDIQSEVRIREWTIILKVLGTPDNLRFDLASDPPEIKEDILSLLISGKTTQELIAGEGGSSLSSTQLLADVLSETAQKKIQDATGLDVVELEYNEAKDDEESDEVKVTVGKELSRRATVKYGVQTKNAKVIRKVITEYKILEKLLMTAFQNTEGDFGGGIQFRLEFR